MKTPASYTKTGTKATAVVKLDKNVFDVKVENHELLKQAYVAYLANGRPNLAVTKERRDVRGGGRKPWKQKGTGRARFGSTRNPIWRGGGVVFGPTGQENYSHKLPTKAKRTALRQALSLASDGSRIKVIETINLEGKTKALAALLGKLEATRNVLIVVDHKDVSKERGAQNLSYAKVVGAKNLNVYDVMNADSIVVTKKALDLVQEWLGTPANKPAKAEAK